MKAFLAALVVMGIAGCTGDPAYETLGPPTRNASLVIGVIGDKSTAPPTLPLNIDGKPAAQVVPGEETLLTVAAGTHIFELAPATTGNPQWCSVIGQRSFEATVADNGLVHVTFTLDCPPIQGTGVLQVDVTATGVSRSSAMKVPVVLTRLNGTRLIVNANVPVFQTTALTLEPGIYEVRLNSINSLCFASNPSAVVAVRPKNSSGLDASITASYSCYVFNP